MKKITRSRQILAAALCCILLLGIFTACSNSDDSSIAKAESEPTSTTQISPEEQGSTDAVIGDNLRSAISELLPEIVTQYEQNPDDPAIALQYAQALYTLGRFEKAQTVLSPLLKDEDRLPEAIYLSALIEYLSGNYDQAEELYGSLVTDDNDDYSLAAQAGLQMVYYQTNEYGKADQLFAGIDLENPLLEMMNAFDETPYQMDWNGSEQTEIPFVTTEPLAVVPIEINGVKMNAFIDTGGPMIAIDESIASSLGIESISNAEGSGAGGTTEISFGKTDSMKLGEVDILNIPVLIMPFDGFENAFDGFATDVHAVIGTNVLQQFIPIMDYPAGRLILVQRSKAGHEHLSELLERETALEEIPFVLANTHYMFAQGSIVNYTGLNMFVDTGMTDNDGAGIELTKETMDLLGIPMPELLPAIEGQGGIGGSDYEEGVFDLLSYGLGNLQLKDGVGLYSTSGHSDGWIDMDGFIGDALIGHHYLKQYKWIVDFDAMTILFCE